MDKLRMTPHPTHGGARAGAGRKPAHGVATIRKTIQLTPREWRELERINKVPSQAVRKLLDAYDGQTKTASAAMNAAKEKRKW